MPNISAATPGLSLIPVSVSLASLVDAATPVTIFLSEILSSEQTNVPFFFSPISEKTREDS